MLWIQYMLKMRLCEKFTINIFGDIWVKLLTVLAIIDSLICNISIIINSLAPYGDRIVV